MKEKYKEIEKKNGFPELYFLRTIKFEINKNLIL